MFAIACSCAACGKNEGKPAEASSLASGYHDVIYKSGIPTYRVISIPSATTIVFYHYYLNADLTPGTFSVDRATVSNITVGQMTLTYYDSDCKNDGETETLAYSFMDDYEFIFTLSSTGSTEYDVITTKVPIPKVTQYNINSYSYSGTCH